MKLSIIILNYNTKALTLRCVDSVVKNTKNLNYEIILIDNGSSEKFPKSSDYRLVASHTNLGFARGNNLAREIARGQYILFLNSDTEVYEHTIKESVKYLDVHPEVGALTCKTILPSGKLDRDARRSFPIPWVAFSHFSGLGRIFPKSRIFSRYWYGYKSADETQEIEALQGAFFLTRKKILDEVEWFSEDYFLDGEDIDLSFKIKQIGPANGRGKYKNIYYPEVSILHIKKASKKKRSLRSKMAGVNSMEIFYKKYLWERYPLLLNFMVIGGIYVLKILRFGKAVVSP